MSNVRFQANYQTNHWIVAALSILKEPEKANSSERERVSKGGWVLAPSFAGSKSQFLVTETKKQRPWSGVLDSSNQFSPRMISRADRFAATWLAKWTRSGEKGGMQRYLCAAVRAERKPQGRAALIKQTQCTTQFCIQVGCPSPRRRFPRTIDSYYLESAGHCSCLAVVSLSLVQRLCLSALSAFTLLPHTRSVYPRLSSTRHRFSSRRLKCTRKRMIN